jgi:hypothetical protein
VNNISFGTQIDNHINWNNHTDEMIPKLSEACGAVWPMLHINKTNTPRLIYYAWVHSIIKYGNIFGGNASNSG